MTTEPSDAPIVPSYGAATLAELAASILASLTPGADPGALALAPGRQACLLLIDGLGWELLRAYPAAAPFLSELAFNGRPLTCGFPATTVTSLGSLGTGRPPGEHGIVGLQVAVPGRAKLMNGLRWPADVDPVGWQPLPTIAQQAAFPVYNVGPRRFIGSLLSTAVRRGVRELPAGGLGALVAQAAAALNESERALVTVYHGDLDGAGHSFGVGSDAWYYQLAHVDKLAEQLAGVLPPQAALYVTGDHGMVDVGADDRLDYDAAPGLREGVAMLGGEPRARHVYAQPGEAAGVLSRWRGELGSRAWVMSRDEAISAGWFGTVCTDMVPRIGDVVAAMAGSHAVVSPSAEPESLDMIGMHGSMTAAEQLVPLLTFTAP